MLQRTSTLSRRCIQYALKQLHPHQPLHQHQLPSLTARTFAAHGSIAHPRKPPPAHIDLPDNTSDTPFDFTASEYEEIRSILKKYPLNYKQSGCIPLLWLAQEHGGQNWVPLAAMNKIAEILEIHPMRVYEVATFYTMFNRQKVGKFHLQVCGTTPCMVRGSDAVFRAIKDYAGIAQGETSKNALFTCDEVECLAACANAPMMQINNSEVYEDLDYDNTIALLKALENGTAKVGPQMGPNGKARNQSEGIEGRTTLKGGPGGAPPCRDFDALKVEWNEKQQKK